MLNFDCVLQEGNTRSEQTSAFIQLLPKRGPTAFQKFIDVLARTDQGHVADYLKKTEGEALVPPNSRMYM